MKLTWIAAVTLGAGLLSAADAPERLEAAAESLKEVMGIPDKSIPQDLLGRAQCIIIVPGLKKGAFMVGARLDSRGRRELRFPDWWFGNRRFHAGHESQGHGPVALDEIHTRWRRFR